MTNWEFQTTCVKNCVSPSLVWELQEFKDLVNNDRLTAETLQQTIDNNF